jgi:hypothetical protein
MWKRHNENPINARVGDCVIRAVSTALSQPWEKTYAELCIQGLMFCDLPSSNAVWGAYLAHKGYSRNTIPNACQCYTVEDFCNDHQNGTYILGTGTHALTVVDGHYYDVWDSGNETPIYYFTKEEV